MRSFRAFAGATVLALLAACGTSPTANRPAAARPTLGAEQARLAALFRGTPVVFEMQADGALRVEVPLHFCFEPRSSTVKAPLAAVLDRVAQSQRGGPSRLLVVAPADPRTRGTALAGERAASVRDYLVGQGLAANRFAAAATGGDAVRIVVAEGREPRLP